MKKISVFALSMGSGGAERVISLLLKELVKDYETTLFLVFNVLHYPIPSGVKVIVVSNSSELGVFQRLLLIPKVMTKYISFLKRERIDIAISFLSIPNLINSSVKFFLRDVKIVISERAFPSIEYASSLVRLRFYRLFIPLFYSKADVLFSNSEWINRDLRDNFNVRNVNMKVIYNPIILPEKWRIFEQTALSTPLKLINVGRLIPVKNQTLIIDAVSKIAEENYHLSIIGDGFLSAKLIEKTKDSPVVFTGNVVNVNDYLLNSDCFILSSDSEGFPNVLLEAMAMGLPVIATNCKSGPLELLNENEPISIKAGQFAKAKYGLMINTGDVDGLYQAIMFYLKDRQMLKLFGLKSRQRAEDFKLENIYPLFKGLVEETR